jgi:ketosteroid isomerase-like protein
MTKFLILIVTITAFQTVAQEAQKEINEQVWKPFITAFNNHDTKGFMALHSKDVVRSPRDGKEVLNWNMYFKQMEKGDQRALSSNMKRQLELRFTERISNPDQAIDVGVYKTTSIKPDGTSRSGYGRFHVVLRKENGIWKILVDTDSSEGDTIGEKEFLAASPLE